MRPRISEELGLLRSAFGEVDHAEDAGNDWFRLTCYLFPAGWTGDGEAIEHAAILFNANAAYPTGDPYGFWTPAGVLFNGQPPKDVTEVGNPVFEGQWTQFSWAPDETWRPGSTVESGSNLTDWARSFAKRLAEGV